MPVTWMLWECDFMKSLIEKWNDTFKTSTGATFIGCFSREVSLSSPFLVSCPFLGVLLYITGFGLLK